MELGDIKLNEKITEAVEKEEFLLFLFSRDLSREKKGQIRSVLIAPIVSQAGCFGVLYANNTFRDEHYSLSDLDYMMLLAMHTATVLEKLWIRQLGTPKDKQSTSGLLPFVFAD